MDVLGMGLFPRADMEPRPGITPAMNAKERYDNLAQIELAVLTLKTG